MTGDETRRNTVVRQALLIARPFAISLEHVKQALARSRKPLSAEARTHADYITDLLGRAGQDHDLLLPGQGRARVAGLLALGAGVRWRRRQERAHDLETLEQQLHRRRAGISYRRDRVGLGVDLDELELLEADQRVDVVTGADQGAGAGHLVHLDRDGPEARWHGDRGRGALCSEGSRGELGTSDDVLADDLADHEADAGEGGRVALVDRRDLLLDHLSVWANTMVDSARSERGLGDNSYALVGANYVNFGSRLGYHFTTLESVCSSSVHDNYVLFRFKGGAADIQRRERRVRFIADVLQRAGFDVDRRQDLLNAWVRKLPSEPTEEKLGLLGRLMGCARQLDVVMDAETTVQECVEAFLSCRYDFFDFGHDPPAQGR